MTAGTTDPAMDHPFARVPYEDFRRAFRTGQKHVEREFAEMKKALSNGADLDTLIEKARELETKVWRCMMLQLWR